MHDIGHIVGIQVVRSFRYQIMKLLDSLLLQHGVCFAKLIHLVKPRTLRGVKTYRALIGRLSPPCFLFSQNPMQGQVFWLRGSTCCLLTAPGKELGNPRVVR